MEMTEVALKQVCKEAGLYITPYLNDVLYCNFQGFGNIGGLEKFTALKALFLEGNAIRSLHGLPACGLTCLYVQGNQIETLEGIEVLSQLQVLNISHNQLKALQGISLLPRLNTLLCASNKLQGSRVLEGLDACIEITTLDIQDNKLDDQEVCAELQKLPSLCSLYIKDNPVLESIKGSRKILVASLPKLTYLDDRPVFELERACAEAWMQGGPEQEHQARLRFQQKQADKEKKNFEAIQQMRRESFRKRREALGLPAGDTDPFYDTVTITEIQELEDPPELIAATERLASLQSAQVLSTDDLALSERVPREQSIDLGPSLVSIVEIGDDNQYGVCEHPNTQLESRSLNTSDPARLLEKVEDVSPDMAPGDLDPVHQPSSTAGLSKDATGPPEQNTGTIEGELSAVATTIKALDTPGLQLDEDDKNADHDGVLELVRSLPQIQELDLSFQSGTENAVRPDPVSLLVPAASSELVAFDTSQLRSCPEDKDIEDSGSSEGEGGKHKKCRPCKKPPQPAGPGTGTGDCGQKDSGKQ